MLRASSSPNLPNDNRTSSTLPRRPHLRDVSVIALACNRSPLATSTPDCSGSGVPPGSASTTSAVDATPIRLAAAAVRGATRSTIFGSTRRRDGEHDGVGRATAHPRRRPRPSRPAAPSTRRPRPAPSGTRHGGRVRRPAPGSRRRRRRTPNRRPAAGQPRGRLAHRVGEAARAPVQCRGQRRHRRPQSDGRRRSRVDTRPAAGRPTAPRPAPEPVPDQRRRPSGPRRAATTADASARRRSARPSRRRRARPSRRRPPGCPATCPAASDAGGRRCRSAAARPWCRPACPPARVRRAAREPPGGAR